MQSSPVLIEMSYQMQGLHITEPAWRPFMSETPEVGLEFLCSDLNGDKDSLALLLDGLELLVFAHNVECVPRLDSTVRDHRASFSQSIEILREAKRLRPDILTKSSIMVGVGETDDEISEAMQMLRDADVDLLTIGQYLAPSPATSPSIAFLNPKCSANGTKKPRMMGFKAVACGPLVRSSYRGGLLYEEAMKGGEIVTYGDSETL